MEYQESFISFLQYEKRSSSHTVLAYKNDLDQFVQFCTEMVGEFNVNTIDNRIIRNWVIKLMEEGHSARTVNRKVTTLKSFFRYLMKLKIIENNPASSVPLPKIKKYLPFFVEQNNLNHLLDDGYFLNSFTGVRDKLIINLFYGTGVRLSELINLKDSDIDIKKCEVKVLGKRNKERIVPFPRSIIPVLEEYMNIRNQTFASSEFLLITENGEKVYAKLV